MNIDVNDRLLASLLATTENDHIYDRRDLQSDAATPYRLLLGGCAISALMRAREVFQHRAISYRGFNVGAAAVAYNFDKNCLGMFTGFNAKVDGTDLINIHAEDIAMNKVKKFGASTVALLVVVGNSQPDQSSGLVTATLHPCGRCRAMLSKSEIVTDNTLIMSATPDFRNIETYDLQNLVNFHGGDKTAVINTARLHQFQQGALETTLWDRDWESKINPVLVENYHLAYIADL